MKGRQIIAMILESFRSSTHTDLTFTGKHLHELTYPGDAKLNLFRNQWIHLSSAMREDDKPRDMALRDTLFDKIRGSTSMQFEIRYYRSLPEGHTEKTYEYLMNMMARTIATEREEKNRLDKAKGIRELLGAKALAAEKPNKNDNKPKNDKTKENPENNALPVLTKPSPKAHGEKGKGKDKGDKGKGKGKRDKSKGRSQSQDRKSIPCVFYFQKGGCSKGKECLYSHAKKHGPRANSQGPGNGKGGDGSHVSFSQRASATALTAHTSMIAMRLPPRLVLPKPKPRPKGRPKLQQPKQKQQQSSSRSEKGITKTISQTGPTARIHLR